MKKSVKELQEEVRRLHREFSILNEISQAVNQSADLHEILNNSLDKITDLMGARTAGVFLLDEKGENLLFTAHRNCSERLAQEMGRLGLGEGATGKAALTGEPIFIEDYPNYPDHSRAAVEEGVKSIAIIPLKSGRRTYGTLNISQKEYHEFTPFEKNLFMSIGQVIGAAMERVSLYMENVKRLEELKTLYSISQEIASRLELKVILQKIIESAVGLLGIGSGAIVLWDNRRQYYATAIVHELPESLIGKEFSSGSAGVVEEVIKKKVPVLFQDYGQSSNRLTELDPYHFQEVAGVPLIVREMIIGVMVVCTADPNKHFQQNEIDLLFNFAHQAAIAIGNAKLYEDSLEKIKQMTILYEIGKTLSSTLDLDELLTKALETIKEKWGYALCAIFFLDREKEELYVKELIGGDLGKLQNQRLRVGVDGIVGWVAKTGEPFYVSDVTKDPRYIEASPEAKSEAVFPLKVRDQLIGVLDIESRDVLGFDEEDLKVLSSFASQVSISIENARLFSELKQTLEELKRAQDQIVQAEKLRAMGEMASGVAHDFNNLLAVILGNIQLLFHQLDHLSPNEIRERLRIIEQSSKDGAETVRRIQEFTGVRRDREFTLLSLGNIIREVAEITEPRWKDQAQKRGAPIELTKRLENIPSILGNPSELREVLTNIVFNAVDAMPEGGQLTLSTRSDGGWVETRISDTGTGMTEEVKRRVFDPFFTTKGVGNSGLGMSVSYGIIKRHGGEILIESEPGQGTVFMIRLPVAEAAKEAKEESLRPIRDVKPARVLVIDDEESVRDILCRMLKVKGHQVAVASNGEEGIERFRTEPFDLVITDLGMPKISGWEVGKTIKGINPKVPIVMITGWGMELNREKMSESGIDLVVSKPFQFDQVLELVSEAMELKEKM